LRQQEGASAEDAEGAAIEELEEENDEIKDPDAEVSSPEQSTPEVEVTLK
jgi:tRNA (guanine9-N1)-methyltransferase